MKAVTIVAATMVFFAAPAVQAQAQDTQPGHFFSSHNSYNEAKVPQAIKAFTQCLASENAGVQESAMAHLAMLKLVRPEIDNEIVVKQLEQLSMTAPLESTRYKAYIASQLFRTPASFASARNVEYEDGDEFFGALATQLRNSLLSYRGQ